MIGQDQRPPRPARWVVERTLGRLLFYERLALRSDRTTLTIRAGPTADCPSPSSAPDAHRRTIATSSRFETSRTPLPLPLPPELALELSAAVASWGGDYVVTDGTGQQTSTWAIERAVRAARRKVEGLPAEFRFHDLRHYLASLLIGSDLDVTVVHHRPWHGSAKTTLDTYGHLWPDRDSPHEPPWCSAGGSCGLSADQ